MHPPLWPIAVTLPWWLGHVLEEFKQAKPLLESTIILIHLLTYAVPLLVILG